MKTTLILATIIAGCVCASTIAKEHDYYRYLRYPSKLVPGVGLDKVEQEGGIVEFMPDRSAMTDVFEIGKPLTPGPPRHLHAESIFLSVCRFDEWLLHLTGVATRIQLRSCRRFFFKGPSRSINIMESVRGGRELETICRIPG